LGRDPLKDEDMGDVRVKIRLTNYDDTSLARGGYLKPELVRSIDVEALVDTGAVRSVMPAHLQEQLGIGTEGFSRVECADGSTAEVPLSRAVQIVLEGRSVAEDFLVLGDEVLIGQTALEKTDLFVDCVGGRLVPNPAHPNSVIMPVRGHRQK
jgi:hypothetical protein